jgi:malate dehydrogenase (oxaloacetate-decarboxylating)(NADP+)
VLDELRQDLYPFSTLRGRPNVLIFPDLDSANIAYKLMMRLGGAEGFGPILLGMAHPVHVLQRASEAAEIANLTAVAVVDAQEHSGARYRAR